MQPYGIRILEVPGNEELNMFTETGIGERVITEEAAYQLVYMMSKVVSEGTGTRARLDGRPAAGKTGTTTAGRDAWFIGFTGDYVAGVWMGYDDNTPLKGVTGGGLPAEIWHEVMVRVHDGLPVTELPMVVPTPRQPPAQEVQTDPQGGFFQTLDEALGGGGQAPSQSGAGRDAFEKLREDLR